MASSSDSDERRKAGYVLIVAGLAWFTATVAAGIADGFDSWDLLGIGGALLTVGNGAYTVYTALRRTSNQEDSSAVTEEDTA